MKVVKTMAPGEKGTNRLRREWGEKLVCVCYREADNRIYTTIEIVVDDREKLPPNTRRHKTLAMRNQQVVAVKIAYEEEELRTKIKRHGGKWSKALKLWLIPYGAAVRLALKDRIQPGKADKCPDVDTSLVF